jgi:hypothetical protein
MNLCARWKRLSKDIKKLMLMALLRSAVLRWQPREVKQAVDLIRQRTTSNVYTGVNPKDP